MGHIGRRRNPGLEQGWLTILRGQRDSGLSIRGYCRRHRLRESAFYFWRKELARRGVRLGRPAAFVPVRIAGADPARPEVPVERAATSRIVLVLGPARRVHLVGPVDRRALAAVLAVLEGTAC